ncbi:hypothetical protein D9615_004709 [Tricholomella constricta]|uniref:N-acetyl-D-glucosamine kinase n=1 Tax=Tricholomella constricta TaxID=117010 RepID=A0A8H5HC05_9AGAR|nr:hypothetical protein D9615_004709 [Tricholomella constricta]
MGSDDNWVLRRPDSSGHGLTLKRPPRLTEMERAVMSNMGINMTVPPHEEGMEKIQAPYVTVWRTLDETAWLPTAYSEVEARVPYGCISRSGFQTLDKPSSAQLHPPVHPPIAMSLYLCVDCGGSKTSAVICDVDGKVLGRALGGPSNFAYLTLDEFIAAVTEAISNALKTCTSTPSADPAPLPPPGDSPFAAAWFGVSGVDSPAAVATITPALSTLLGIPAGPRLAVANDTHLLAAPVRLYPDVSHAVAVIGGTGSIAVTFRENGGTLEELGRIGGWGWILGDEGGGFSVGREAIRLILLEHDNATVSGKPLQSTLTTQIMERFGIADIMEILTIIHLPDPAANKGLTPDSPAHLLIPREKRLSSLAPLVFKAAFEDRDELALRILRTCAGLLVETIIVLLGDGSGRTVKAQDSVISFGGSLVGIEAYRKLILDDLAQRGHVFRYVEFVDDAAAVGATGLAAAARAFGNGQP